MYTECWPCAVISRSTAQLLPSWASSKIFTQTAPEPLDPAGARKTAIKPLGSRVKNKLGEKTRTIYMMGAVWSV